VIVKVVNTSADPVQTDLALSGANISGKGTAIVLTSENAADENSLDNPAKVSPKTEALNFNGSALTRAFPGNSFTVLRLQTK
jgi:alpha-L-arabinofuranosidase